MADFNLSDSKVATYLTSLPVVQTASAQLYAAQDNKSHIVKTAASLSVLGLGFTKSIFEFTVNKALGKDAALRLDERVSALAQGSATTYQKLSAQVAEVRKDPSKGAFELMHKVLDVVLPEELPPATSEEEEMVNAMSGLTSDTVTSNATTATTSNSNTDYKSSATDKPQEPQSAMVRSRGLWEVAVSRVQQRKVRVRGFMKRQLRYLQRYWNAVLSSFGYLSPIAASLAWKKNKDTTATTTTSSTSTSTDVVVVSDDNATAHHLIHSALELASHLRSRLDLSAAVQRLQRLSSLLSQSTLPKDVVPRVSLALLRVHDSLIALQTALRDTSAVRSAADAVHLHAPQLSAQLEVLVARTDAAVVNALRTAATPLATPQQQPDEEPKQLDTMTPVVEDVKADVSFSYPLDESSINQTLDDDE